MTKKIVNPNLTDEQKYVLFNKGTEPPFSGKLLRHNGDGEYRCAACGNVIFKSENKYETTQPGLTGWPSFSDASNNDAVKLSDDYSFGMHRIEVACKKCDSHLGHLFDDDSSPTGKHYCVNSVCLDFEPQK